MGPSTPRLGVEPSLNNLGMEARASYFADEDILGDNDDAAAAQAVQRDLLKRLKKGRFVIFQRPDTLSFSGKAAGSGALTWWVSSRGRCGGGREETTLDESTVATLCSR